MNLNFLIVKKRQNKMVPKTKNPKLSFEVLKERKTRLELATTSLEGWSSTN